MNEDGRRDYEHYSCRLWGNVLLNRVFKLVWFQRYLCQNNLGTFWLLSSDPAGTFGVQINFRSIPVFWSSIFKVWLFWFKTFKHGRWSAKQKEVGWVHNAIITKGRTHAQVLRLSVAEASAVSLLDLQLQSCHIRFTRQGPDVYFEKHCWK